MQGGFQLPDWSLRGFDDHTNRPGTFYFSDLDPTRRASPMPSSSSGQRQLARLEKQVGAVRQRRLATGRWPDAVAGTAVRLAKLLPRRQQRRAPDLPGVGAG